MTYVVRYYRDEHDPEPGSIGNFDTQYECVEWARDYREHYPGAIFDVIDTETGDVRFSLLPLS